MYLIKLFRYLFSAHFNPYTAIKPTDLYNKSNSMAGTVQVEANLQEELSIHLHFRKLMLLKMPGKWSHFMCCTSSHCFPYIKISTFLPLKSRSMSLCVTYHSLANIQSLKVDSCHFSLAHIISEITFKDFDLKKTSKFSYLSLGNK